jgi:hypothetical protein
MMDMGGESHGLFQNPTKDVNTTHNHPAIEQNGLQIVPCTFIREYHHYPMTSVVVLGASTNPDRYAFMAMQRLQEHGHKA